MASCPTKPQGVDVYFAGNIEDARGVFRMHWKERTIRKVKELLTPLSADERRRILSDMKMQLESIAGSL